MALLRYMVPVICLLTVFVAVSIELLVKRLTTERNPLRDCRQTASGDRRGESSEAEKYSSWMRTIQRSNECDSFPNQLRPAFTKSNSKIAPGVSLTFASMK